MEVLDLCLAFTKIIALKNKNCSSTSQLILKRVTLTTALQNCYVTALTLKKYAQKKRRVGHEHDRTAPPCLARSSPVAETSAGPCTPTAASLSAHLLKLWTYFLLIPTEEAQAHTAYGLTGLHWALLTWPKALRGLQLPFLKSQCPSGRAHWKSSAPL